MPQDISILNTLFDKVFVITIERNVDRRKAFEKKFAGLEFEFVFGVDGWKLSQEQIDKVYDDAATNSNMGRSLHVGEIGATLSHRLVFDKISHGDYEHVLILEDDITFETVDFREVENLMKQVPSRWELVYLGYGSNYTLTFWKRLRYLFPYVKRKLMRRLPWDHYYNMNLYSKKISAKLSSAGWHTGAYAYAVSKSGAIKMKDRFARINVVIDDGLSHLCIEKKVKAFISNTKFFVPNENAKSSVWNNE